jgi:alkane 1-monooxygenase
MSRANLSPRKRDRILAAYPPPAREPGPEPCAPGADASGAPPPAPAEVLAARCPGCGYTYEVAEGHELEGLAAGTAWADVPDDWCCPDCGVRDKVDFVAVEPQRTG